MDIFLDKNNPIPIGIQVKEQIKMLVDSGANKEGDKLPSITQLAAFLGVNKNTIVTVLKDLEKDGYVESFRGKGVFIKKANTLNQIDINFLEKIDAVIREAQKKEIGSNELINLINARFHHAKGVKSARVLFIIGISQELVDINLQKLKQNIPGVEFEGLLFNKDSNREQMEKSFDWADVILVPAIMYDSVKDFLPENKPLIKTMANLKLLSNLKKGIDKKSKVAVIGVTQKGTQALANLFISSRMFKPKLVISLNDLDKHKKDVKDIDSFVICISAREAVERLKLKDKGVYFFSDYIDADSIEEIRRILKKI